LKRFIREYRIELAALLIGLLGVFLIVEQIDLRSLLTGIAEAVRSNLNSAVDKILGYFTNFSLSDMLGWLIACLVLVFVAWRIRYRFSRSGRWEADQCPRCGSELHRVHRSGFDRILCGTFLPDARRYRCDDKCCAWTGLRRRRASEHHHHPSTFPEIDRL